jgi:nucleoside-diphosphate-sugar epimerase
MNRILIFGNKSFIQENFFIFLKKKKIKVFKKKFSDLKKIFFFKDDIIINCSISSEFFYKEYKKLFDRNYLIARHIKKKNIKLIFLSTRMVYQQKRNIIESSKLHPINIYASNCLKSENLCRKILKNNLTILRISNVIGLEFRKKRQSLMSKLIKGIKKNKIILDNSYDFKKDLIPINFFCQYLYKIIRSKYSGLINLGSGISLTVLSLVKTLVLKKNVKILIDHDTKNRYDKSYSYNIRKLVEITKIRFSKSEVLKEINKISKKI